MERKEKVKNKIVELQQKQSELRQSYPKETLSGKLKNLQDEMQILRAIERLNLRLEIAKEVTTQDLFDIWVEGMFYSQGWEEGELYLVENRIKTMFWNSCERDAPEGEIMELKIPIQLPF